MPGTDRVPDKTIFHSVYKYKYLPIPGFGLTLNAIYFNLHFNQLLDSNITLETWMWNL